MARCKSCNGMVEKGILKCPYCGSDMSFNKIDGYVESEVTRGNLKDDAVIKTLEEDIEDNCRKQKAKNNVIGVSAHIITNVALILLSIFTRRDK